MTRYQTKTNVVAVGLESITVGVDVEIAYTVEDKKTFPFHVLQNGTVCIVVRCVLRNGIKTLQKRYAFKKRLWNG